MATLAELVREHTTVDQAVVAHLQRLVGSWGMLSDLCFADLVLWVPLAGEDHRFVVIAQVRPTTSQTLYIDDLVGAVFDETTRPLVARTFDLGSIVEGEVAIARRAEQARMVAIPVRFRGQVVAVVTRESALSVGRRPGQLERIYIETFDRLTRMIAAGDFPFPVDDEAISSDDEAISEVPRVGDGVLVLDDAARVEYASPNAVNALHRMGMYRAIVGVRLDEAGLEQNAVAVSYGSKLPMTVEVVRGPDVAVVLRCLPLLEHQRVTGALVLLRDVSELRRRDRLLLSKDAAIREVHHRVKNNLQTISSLLRLQARRLPNDQARHVLEESERRVRSIAVVHEILSRDTRDELDFNDILPPLVAMAEDLGTPAQPVRVFYQGEAGQLPGSVATPLAVVLNELLQNAAEHGRRLTKRAGHDRPPAACAEGGVTGPSVLRVQVQLERGERDLSVTVRDNGVGLPEEFSVDDTTTLGLSIVRGLVASQLGGTIRMYTEQGTVVEISIPVAEED